MKEKSVYEEFFTFESLFTGGKVVQNQNDLYLNGGDCISILNLKTKKLHKIEQEQQVITAFHVFGDFIALSLQSLQIQIYHNLQQIHSFKAHEAPILVMDIAHSLVATGSADSTIKCWDLKKGHATHNFKGHGGVISALKFHPTEHIIVSGSDDCSVRIWDLHSKQCKGVLRSHVSLIRGICFMDNLLFTCARDKVCIKWNLSTLEAEHTFVAYEQLEGCEIVTYDGQKCLATGGEDAVLKIWNVLDGTLIETQVKDKNNQHQIQGLSEHNGELLAWTSDQNIWFFDLTSGIERNRQIAGYNEEILDIQLIENDTKMAVITNTEQIRIYDLDSKDCEIIYGHSDIILCCTANDRYLATGSKDNTIKVWDNNYNEVIEFNGHTGSVTALCFSKDSDYLISGSQDKTIKLWNINDNSKSKFTVAAHEKDIQGIDIAPRDQLFVTCSLDRTAKLWNMDGTLRGTLKGHKRGVWKAIFSPVDQVVATCSTDKSIKLWSVRDLSCIKTLEGHLNTVLNLSFVTAGMQLLSTGSDGLLKLWNTRSGECVGTFDGHEDRIWALGRSKDESLVATGSSDSTIVLWKDVSEEKEAEELGQRHHLAEQEQNLELFLKRKDFKNAIILAIELKQPMRLLGIFKQLESLGSGKTGSNDVDEYLAQIDDNSLQIIVSYIIDWNTHAAHARTANVILNLLLKSVPPSRFTSLPNGDFEKLIVYLEKHVGRYDEMLKESYLLDYTMQRMNSVF